MMQRLPAVMLGLLGTGLAQPPPRPSVSTTSTACTGISDGSNCAKDGSNNYHSWSGSYNSATGKFSGTMITNGCSQNAYGYCELCNGGQGMDMSNQHTASCNSVTFPASGYDTTPKEAPRRGIVGLSVYGVNIYGPLEAGFGSGTGPNPCTNGQTGVCSGGIDVPNCEAKIEHSCGTSNVNYGLMLDTCGGHAMPYHYHKDLKCDYNHQASGHSPLIGIALDGRGVYGLYETSQTRPSNLDTCNGHTAATPAFSGDGGSNSVTSTSSSSVYHYHVSSTAPYTLGCYGPADLAACKSATSGCGDSNGYELITTATYPTGFCYDLECSCYDANGMNNDGSGCGITNPTRTPTANPSRAAVPSAGPSPAPAPPPSAGPSKSPSAPGPGPSESPSASAPVPSKS
eukprot:Hpha_TRINITY_DN15056_c0_g8::TRINITY_DN15056_c0_g8_i1::g.126109::m.126109